MTTNDTLTSVLEALTDNVEQLALLAKDPATNSFVLQGKEAIADLTALITAPPKPADEMLGALLLLSNCLSLTPQSYIELADEYTPGLSKAVKQLVAIHRAETAVAEKDGE